ncbi:Hypothetical_protein [Hexamita inflata]|uniref:Hypothetical_protein n=1 Tax=Hexamita inflata TaxID=28002 RepID=A0AA86PAY0_9EUKA|nr:Hypothetical protein HINF_LOCUS23076 [Hexamita inflata]
MSQSELLFSLAHVPSLQLSTVTPSPSDPALPWASPSCNNNNNKTRSLNQRRTKEFHEGANSQRKNTTTTRNWRTRARKLAPQITSMLVHPFSDDHISFLNDDQQENNIPLQPNISRGVITRQTSSQNLRQLFLANGVCFGNFFVDNSIWLSRGVACYCVCVVSYLFKVQTWEWCHKLTILFLDFLGSFHKIQSDIFNFSYFHVLYVLYLS